MKEKFPKSFYLKLSAIIMVIVWVYAQHAVFISATFQREDLSTLEAVTVVVQHLLDVHPSQRQSRQEVAPVQTSSKPHIIDEQVKQYPAYQQAVQIAMHFNEQIDLDRLNHAFLAKVNELRTIQGVSPAQYGMHLLAGVRERAMQLGQYHYFGNETLENTSFRTLFPMIDSPEYRLSEQLYEVYISARDVHLQTWENEDILADYVLKVFDGEKSSLIQVGYTSQALAVYTEASDYRANELPYVRLVVVLVTDSIQ